jgi:hypothetical protein
MKIYTCQSLISSFQLIFHWKKLRKRYLFSANCVPNFVIVNWSLISLACPDKFPLHAEENTVFQIVVQARHTVFHTQGLHQDGFPLSSVPELSWIISSYWCIHEVADGLFEWLWYVSVIEISNAWFLWHSWLCSCSNFLISIYMRISFGTRIFYFR